MVSTQEERKGARLKPEKAANRHAQMLHSINMVYIHIHCFFLFFFLHVLRERE